MNIYKRELKKLIVLHEYVEEVMFRIWAWKGWLDCGGGRDGVSQRKGDGKLLRLMICYWLMRWCPQTGGDFNSINVPTEPITGQRQIFLKSLIWSIFSPVGLESFWTENRDPSMILQFCTMNQRRSWRATTWLKSQANIELNLYFFSNHVPNLVRIYYLIKTCQ